MISPDGRVDLLRKNVEAAYERITEVVDMLGYADAGGRDWETWNTLLAGGLSRARDEDDGRLQRRGAP
jgi:hypothetical protein